MNIGYRRSAEIMTVSHRSTGVTWLMNQLKLVENKSLTEAKVGFGFDPAPNTAKSPTKRNRIKLDSFSLEHLFLATSLWVEDDAS